MPICVQVAFCAAQKPMPFCVKHSLNWHCPSAGEDDGAEAAEEEPGIHAPLLQPFAQEISCVRACASASQYVSRTKHVSLGAQEGTLVMLLEMS